MSASSLRACGRSVVPGVRSTLCLRAAAAGARAAGPRWRRTPRRRPEQLRLRAHARLQLRQCRLQLLPRPLLRPMRAHLRLELGADDVRSRVAGRLRRLASHQGSQSYRHLKMPIPIPIPAEYDDTDTG